MNFNAIPDNFAPIEGGLVYSFDCGSVLPVADVKIINVATNEMQAVCRLRNLRFGSVDIAPYVRKMMNPTPATGNRVIVDGTRSANVCIEVGGVRSAVRRYSLCPIGADPKLLTTMPLQRTIAAGESDELTFYAPEGGFLNVTEYFTDDCTNYEYEIAPSNEVQVFRLNTDDFNSDTYAVDVNVEIGGRVSTLCYYYVCRPAGARRLKWLSSCGSIESYTFPVCGAQRLKVDKSRIYGADGHRITGVEAERTLLLSSDYEPLDVITPIEELLVAKQVWMETPNGTEPADVMSTENVIACNGELNAIKVEVRPQRREVRL